MAGVPPAAASEALAVQLSHNRGNILRLCKSPSRDLRSAAPHEEIPESGFPHLAYSAADHYASQKWPDKIPFWKTAEKENTAKKSARPTTAIVTSRDISFAITAAGEITPAEQVSRASRD